MSEGRVLYHSASGIGNVIQMAPAVRQLSKHFAVDLWHHPDCYKDAHLSLRRYVDRVFVGDVRPTGDYRFQVFSSYVQKCYWHYQRLDGVDEIHADINVQNEVESNMSVLPRIGIHVDPDDPEVWSDCCAYTTFDSDHDVSLHAGGKPGREWSSKRWRNFEELASRLAGSGLSVVSIGSQDEYIPGTRNMCGLPLLESFGVIRNSRVHVANDCGSYHAACALGIPNVAIFCSTSVAKNYHSGLHRDAVIMGQALPCQPCQMTPQWGRCLIGERCRDLRADYVVHEVNALLASNGPRKDSVECSQ